MQGGVPGAESHPGVPATSLVRTGNLLSRMGNLPRRTAGHPRRTANLLWRTANRLAPLCQWRLGRCFIAAGMRSAPWDRRVRCTFGMKGLCHG